MDFAQIEAALDAGKLLVETLDGRWVTARRASHTIRGANGYRRVLTKIDGEIEFTITSNKPFWDDIRIAAERAA
jgi:hypothetical protein